MAEKRQVSIFINGTEINNTIKSIGAEFKKASNEIALLTRGTEAYEKKAKEIQDLNGILTEHRNQLKGVKQGVDGMKVGLSSIIGLAAGAFSVDLVIQFGKELFNTAVKMDTLERKAKTVFKETLPGVTAEAEKNASAMGLTNAEYVAAAANIADLLVPMGFQRKEAAGISTELVNLSGALAEWSGGQRSSKEVSEILSKALLGERDALQELGIAISEEDIKNRLKTQGLEKTTGATLEQAKAAATLQLILEKSADAQEAYAKNSDSAIRRQAELSAKFSEITEKISRLLLPVFERLTVVVEGVVDAFGYIADSIEETVKPAESASAAFNEQAGVVKNLEENIVPLLDRYDKLSAESNRSTEEQKELDNIIKILSKNVPIAVSAWDQYGNALGINTEKAREFIAVEKARLKFVNEAAITENKKLVADLQNQATALQNKLNAGSKTVTSQNSAAGIGFGSSVVNLTNEEILTISASLSQVQEKVTGVNAEIKRLLGGNLDLPEVNADEEAKKKAEAEKKRLDDLNKKLDEDKNKKPRKKTNDELEDEENARFARLLKLNDQYNAGINEKIEQAGKDQLERLRANSLEELNAKLEGLEAIQLADLNYEDEKAAAAERIRVATISDQQSEIEQLQAHYFYLLELAQQYGIDTTALKVQQQTELDAINKKYADEELQKQAEYNRARADSLAASFEGLGNVVSATFELLGGEGEKFANFQKVATLAKIAFDTAAAISSLTAASSANPANAVTFGGAGFAQFATGLVRILANIAQAKKILSAAPKVQQKYLGSYLNVTGADDGRQYNARNISTPNTGLLPGYPVLFQSNATGRPVLASERGSEYFVSASDMKNPRVANYVRMIDNVSRNKGIPQFAEGGLNPASNQAQADNLSPLIMQLSATIAQLNQVLSRGLTAVITDPTIGDIRKREKQLSDNSGGYL